VVGVIEEGDDIVVKREVPEFAHTVAKLVTLLTHALIIVSRYQKKEWLIIAQMHMGIRENPLQLHMIMIIITHIQENCLHQINTKPFLNFFNNQELSSLIVSV